MDEHFYNIIFHHTGKPWATTSLFTLSSNAFRFYWVEMSLLRLKKTFQHGTHHATYKNR